MITITGAHNTAIVFTDSLEKGAESQIRALCDMPQFKSSKIRVMPDVHAGMGCTIGTTMTITDKVVPGMVGVDIGCGMEAVRLEEKEIDLRGLDALIRRQIPSGRDIRKREHPFSDRIDLNALHCADEVNVQRARLSIGTLGGGNHFIEVGEDEEGRLWLVVHSGSRHLGHEVATLYQNKGFESLCGDSAPQRGSGKKQHRAQRRKRDCPVPRDMAWVEGRQMADYLDDMALVQRFAVLNRHAMVDVIIEGLGLSAAESFTTIHNYIDTREMVLRKGAVSAHAGEKLLIPINMRDGSLICLGRGNPDWNHSAPHGAGRLMSRRDARDRLSMAEYQKTMAGVFSTSVSLATLDEAPMAYKDGEDIIRHIGPTAQILHRVKPVYKFKAAE